MSIIEAWENSRMSYQQRYVRFLRHPMYSLVYLACQYSRYKNWSITTAD